MIPIFSIVFSSSDNRHGVVAFARRENQVALAIPPVVVVQAVPIDIPRSLDLPSTSAVGESTSPVVQAGPRNVAMNEAAAPLVDPIGAVHTLLDIDTSRWASWLPSISLTVHRAEHPAAVAINEPEQLAPRHIIADRNVDVTFIPASVLPLAVPVAIGEDESKYSSDTSVTSTVIPTVSSHSLWGTKDSSGLASSLSGWFGTTAPTMSEPIAVQINQVINESAITSNNIIQLGVWPFCIRVFICASMTASNPQVDETLITSFATSNLY